MASTILPSWRGRCLASFILSFALLTAVSSAQKLLCRGTISNRLIKTSIVVRGGSCVLNNVRITGDVIVKNGGTLTTVNEVDIKGCVHCFQCNQFNLWGALTVKGGISVMDSVGQVFLGHKSRCGAVSLIHVPKFVAWGNMESVSSINSGPMHLYGASVRTGGVIRRGGYGKTELCGVKLEGGINLSKVNGHLLISRGRKCAQSIIDGSIYVSKGVGNVLVGGADFTATDIIVVEQKGHIRVQNVKLSDVAVSKLIGSVLLNSIFADSDASLFKVSGTASVIRSKFEGDVNVGFNNVVNLSGNDFGLEVVTVYSNRGWVSVIGNKRFSISLTENQSGISFNRNDLRSGTITKNRNAVHVNNNKAQLLTCYGNRFRPRGRFNNIFLRSPGQCAGLKTGPGKGFSPKLLS